MKTPCSSASTPTIKANLSFGAPLDRFVFYEEGSPPRLDRIRRIHAPRSLFQDDLRGMGDALKRFRQLPDMALTPPKS